MTIYANANGSIIVEAEDLNYDDDFVISQIDTTASGGEILRVRSDRRDANATTTFDGPEGTYSLTLYAYDENDGNGRITVWVNGRPVRATVLSRNLGSYLPNAQTQVQIVIDSLHLQRGDRIEIEAVRDGSEMTSLDKLVFTPVSTQPSQIVIEAEDLNYDNDFVVSGIDRSASGRQILRVRSDRRDADATTVFNGADGTYNLTLDAYDENDGHGRITVWVNGQQVKTTVLSQNLGSRFPDRNTKVQIVVNDLALKRGDLIRIEARRDRYEYTSLDKITFDPVVTAPEIEITSNGGDRTAVVTVAENATAVTDFEVNVGDDNVTYRINAGADRDLFEIDEATGVLSFKNAPDWENPLDVGSDNVYEVNVIAVGADSGDGQFVSVVVKDVEETPPGGGPTDAPVEITSNGGGNTAFINLVEGTSAVTDFEVNVGDDNVIYRINAGADREFFEIDPRTGQLSFKSAPDFQQPLDADANNLYEVNVIAAGATSGDGQFISVKVNDQALPEGPDETDPVSVYLLAGQSNLVGVAQLANLTDTRYTQPFSAAQIWSRPQVDFVDLAPGFDGQTVRLGPELSFGRQIVANTDENVLLIKYGLGSTTLAEDWQVDGSGTQFNQLKDVVDVALDSLTNQGLTYDIEGLVWMQGESDTYDDTFAQDYEDNLLGFVDGVREVYGENLEIAIGLIRNDLPTSARNRELVRDAQRAVSASDANVFLVDTDALGGSEVLRPGDTTHYNADGQILLGNAFAEAFVV